MVTVTCQVSSLSSGTAFKKSGQEIGTFVTSFNEGCPKFPYEFVRLVGFAPNWSFYSMLEDLLEGSGAPAALIGYFETPAVCIITNEFAKIVN